MPKSIPLAPVAYTVYKRMLGRCNDLYSLWQQTITENNDLAKENRELKQRLNDPTSATRPTTIRP